MCNFQLISLTTRLTFSSVFFLPVFEVDVDQKVPSNKTELKMLYDQKKANFFHIKICKVCHRIPDGWMNNVNDTEMDIYAEVKRQNQYNHWEPFFISTQDVSFNEERFICFKFNNYFSGPHHFR